MCGEQLVLAHGGREQVLEEVGRRHGALAALAGDDQLRVERQDRRPAVTGRVGVHERSAERAAVADLRVGDLADRLVQQARGRSAPTGRRGSGSTAPSRRSGRCRPRRRCSFSVSIWPMSTISSGAFSRIRSTGSSDCPPAITLASSLWASADSASSTEVGCEVVELGGDHWPAPSMRSVWPSWPVDSSKCGAAPPVVGSAPPESPAWIAFQTRSGVHGIWMSLTPNWRTASTTALTTAGVEAIVPASPTPLVPSVFVVDGVVLWSTSKLIVSAAVGTR